MCPQKVVSALEECPSAEELARFCVGKLSDQRLEAIASHLGDCPECESVMRQAGRQSDPMIEALRHPREDSLDDIEFGRLTSLVEEILQAYLPNHSVVAPMRAEGTLALQGPDQIGPYQLLSKLGAGGMGVVYKALHKVLGKVVALKVLAARRTESVESIRRFYREMKAVGKLHHPNIVAAYDAGEAEGVHYLTMEFVEGVNLSVLVKRHGPLRSADACELVRQAAVGLAHVHEHGLVHRDLKPSNLMLATTGEVKVLDLGLALLEVDAMDNDSLTASDQAGIGTADYMAPEQIGNAHGVDIRADIYSLGCTLYQLLAGRAPFSGPQFATALQKAMAHVNQGAVPIIIHRPDVPAQLGAVIERMLAKNPEERYATPGELAKALTPFAIGANLSKLIAEADGNKSAVGSKEIDQSQIATESYSDSSVTSTSVEHWLAKLAAHPPLTLAGAAMVLLMIIVGVGVWLASGPKPTAPTEPQKPGVATPSPIKPETIKPVTSAAETRRVAEWVLGLGGTVGVYVQPGKILAARNRSQLPSEPFNLYVITLTGNGKISDEDLKNFTALPRLGILNLNQTQVSDAGLVHLRGLTSLKYLHLEMTNVSETGLKAVQAALPDCQIER